MSAFGGFGGFGQQQNQQNQQQQGAFGGGFGAAQPANQGFGSTGNTAFGAPNTTGGGLFGGGASTGGFGSSGGAFGGATGAFGAAKPGGFGTTTTTSGGTTLFGGSTVTAGTGGFGGFGSTSAAAPSPFGASSTTGGGLFGQQKPAFGAATPAPSNPFGGAATASPFGGAVTGAFGAPVSSALGGAAGECQGTGSVPFQAVVEKEPNSNTNQQNSFQSISFQQPYQKFSPEELRLADYAQGRKYGNGNGQAGAFGTPNFGGGGFGTSQPAATGGFGAPAAAPGGLFGAGTSSPFGGNQPAQTGGFGTAAATPTGLFGGKTAVGGIFGAPATAQPTGNLFGGGGTAGFGGAAATGGFGTTTNTTAGGGLFGGVANTAAKPFSFGNPAPASTTAFGGGTTATPAFGGTGGLFGGGAAQQASPSPFGQQTQQPAANNPFGGFGGTTQQGGTTPLFGAPINNQAKPVGLFGQPAAAAGTNNLFGQQQPANNNLFGTTPNNQAANNGLFGVKPAATGLFGASAAQGNTGGGIFGGGGIGNQNQGQQQQNSGGIFGGLNSSNQPQKTSLFGAPQPQQGGNNLFGGANTQQQGGLFGGLNTGQQQQPTAPNALFGGGNSMFGGPQQGQQTPQSLTTSISDNAAFGSSSLFSNLASTQVNNPGPIATPLTNSAVKQKKTAAIPMYKLNSASTSRYTTPQKRGFGFSYSNYNTPNSASSTSSTPGAFGSSMLGGTFSRTLNKSVSTSSLRRSFNTEDSILAPGAFSASPSARYFGSTGSVKKLTINRGLRSDLFSPPTTQQGSSNPAGGILKKRVSFDANTASNGTNGTSSPLKHAVRNGEPSSEELGLSRSSSNGTLAATGPDKENAKSKELAIVHEDTEESNSAGPSKSKPVTQRQTGEYWMKPTKEEIENMARAQRQSVGGLTVGCEGTGQIVFESPVDLTNIDLDEIPGKIVVFATRQATVYPVASKKPPMGKGLNVPSIISLQNSWPRKKDEGITAPGGKSSSRFKKHVERLQKVPDTEFIDYIWETGTWIFRVKHFTTYGFPEDEEDSDGEGVSEFGQSTLSAPPDTPTPKTRTPNSHHLDQSFASTSQITYTESDPEDTFEFRKKKAPPGAFDDQEMYDDGDMEEEYDEQDQQSFLDERSVGSQSENGVEEPMDQDDVFHNNESVSIVDQEMAGSYPDASNTAELDGEYSQDEDNSMGDISETPGAILKARMRAVKNSGTPMKNFAAGNDWTSALQNTVSPQKQDRAMLKSLIDIHGNDSRPDAEPTQATRRVVSDGRGFATSIDLMNSLFGQARSPVKVPKVPSKGKGFEWPYAKRPKTNNNDNILDDFDQAFHDSMKPSWGPDGTLVYAAPPNSKSFGRSSRRVRERDGLLTIQKGSVVSESRDVRFAKFSNEAAAHHLTKQKALTFIDDSRNVPFASLPDDFSFSDFFDDSNVRDPAAVHEKLVWQLASILFDELTVPDELKQFPRAADRLRKDMLSSFWQKLVDEASSKHVAMARSNEEKAVASLSGHMVPDACLHLINGNDFHLATLVSLIGAKDSMRKDIREQLNDWQKSRVLSEFNQPVRTIYELLAGNVCVCDGLKGPAEDRIDSFVISKRFGLDWRQAFGLRLWYGILSGDSMDHAIEGFAQDLAQDRETSRPHAWYVEQKVPTLWEDEGLEDREDLLWGLLKLYTFQDADLESTLRPENSQLSPLDIRLTWQLSQALVSSSIINYGSNGEEKADHTTLSFAAQLTNEGSWLDAVFVLLHLSSDEARAKSIQNHLARNAGRIGSEDSQSFTTLTQTFKIPAPWVWEAKALYMRSVEKNSCGEVECLVKAGSFNEAHRTFSRDVAPITIIEMDYDTLRSLLDGFHGKEHTISEWHLGGEIYQDFLELLDSQKKFTSIDHAVLERLLAGLPAVVEDSRHPSFMETVAVETISGVVAKTVIAMGKKGKKSEMHKVLRLPLTKDKYLKHTVELSLEYYRDIMSSGR